MYFIYLFFFFAWRYQRTLQEFGTDQRGLIHDHDDDDDNDDRLFIHPFSN
jgi:hypothetical protein